MEQEVWRPVVGYEGLYEVSSLGRVKKVNDSGELVFLPLWRSDGYLNTALIKDKVRTKLKAHRLVAQAFIPNPEGFKEVNHMNHVRDCNLVSNLEWCDRSHNLKHAFARRRQIIDSCRNRPVRQIDEKTGRIWLWPDMAAAAKAWHSSEYKIRDVCLGVFKEHRGSKWEFADA